MNGILSALRQHDGSIDELAKLPQNLIMQMAQRKEIGAEMVAPILARKAQMADAIARTKALQKGQAQGPAPTVMEQLMQKTADTEQPEPEEMGIASNPIPERNYAGGGIVAFAEGGTPEEQRRKALEALNINMPDLPADYRGTLSDYLSNPEWARAYEKNQQDRAIARRAILENNPIPAVNRDILNPSPSIRAQAQAPAPTTPVVATPPTTAAKPAPKTETKPAAVTTKDTGLKSLTNKPNVGDAEPKTPSELQQVLAQYRSDIEGSKDEKDKARKEAMWSRLLEAGLNVMGGQSSNFAQNLALAGPAAKGFGEDIKGLRAEENTKRKQLAELGLKGYELNQAAKKAAVEEAYMKQHGTYYDRAGQAALISANRPTAGATGADRLDVQATKELLASAQKQMLSAKKAERPAIQAQIDTYVKRLESLGGISSAVPAASASGAFNYVPGRGLVPVQ